MHQLLPSEITPHPTVSEWFPNGTSAHYRLFYAKKLDERKIITVTYIAPKLKKIQGGERVSRR